MGFSGRREITKNICTFSSVENTGDHSESGLLGEPRPAWAKEGGERGHIGTREEERGRVAAGGERGVKVEVEVFVFQNRGGI